MGRYLGSWDIDDVLRVHKQTSAVTTGAATDADAAPSWRVYEDDTATPVTTGSFTTLNSQTGFYVAAITLAASIGYEAGKAYALRSQATVGGVIGADVDTFQIRAKVNAVASATLNAHIASITAGAMSANAFAANALQGLTVGSVAGAVTVGSTSASAIATAVQALALTLGSTSQSAIAAATAALAHTLGSTAVAAIQSGLASQASVDTIDDFLDTEVAAIKAKTDQLTFGVANVLNANLTHVNEVSITGNGQSGTEWGPGS